MRITRRQLRKMISEAVNTLTTSQFDDKMSDFAFRLKKATIGGIQQTLDKTLSGNPFQSLGMGTDEKAIRKVFLDLKNFTMQNKNAIVDIIRSGKYSMYGVSEAFGDLSADATLLSAVITILNGYFSEPRVAGRSIGSVMHDEGMKDPRGGDFSDYLERLYGISGFDILNDEDFE